MARLVSAVVEVAVVLGQTVDVLEGVAVVGAVLEGESEAHVEDLRLVEAFPRFRRKSGDRKGLINNMQ